MQEALSGLLFRQDLRGCGESAQLGQGGSSVGRLLCHQAGGDKTRGSWQLWMGVHWRLRAGPLWSSPSREGSQLLCLRGTSVSGWQAGVASWKLAGAEGMGAPGRFGLHCPAPGPHPHAPGRSPRRSRAEGSPDVSLGRRVAGPRPSPAVCRGTMGRREGAGLSCR